MWHCNWCVYPWSHGVSDQFARVQSFLRKLKFHYLEQHAKDKYVKIIVNDDAPLITAEDNDALRLSNEAKKAKLKVAKERLAAKYEEIRRLAPEVEHGQWYTSATLWEPFLLSGSLVGLLFDRGCSQLVTDTELLSRLS